MAEDQTDQTNLSGDIQKLLLREYLKKHLDVSEDQVFLRCKNGRMVFDRLDEILQRSQAQKRIRANTAKKDLTIRDIPMDELTADHEERHQSCVNSAQIAKKCLERLFNTVPPILSVFEKNDYQLKIRRYERATTEAGRMIADSKKKFLLLMESEKIPPHSSLVRTNLLELLTGILDLLKGQRTLLNTEIDLTNRYFDFSQKLIQKHFPTIKKCITPKSIKTIIAFYRFLANKAQSKPIANTELSYDELDTLLQIYQTDRENKRKAIDKLDKIIAFISRLIQDIAEKEEAAKQEATQSLPPKSPPSRMNFLAHLKNRFHFGKK